MQGLTEVIASLVIGERSGVGVAAARFDNHAAIDNGRCAVQFRTLYVMRVMVRHGARDVSISPKLRWNNASASGYLKSLYR